MFAIDPGEVHCGTATFVGKDCFEVQEFSPARLFLELESLLRTDMLDVVVMEEFRLYPGKANEQSFSQIKTVEVIGVIRYLVARWSGALLVQQPALIKKPTRARMKALGIGNRAVTERKGGHCADAVLHGQHYIMHGYEKYEE